MKRTNAVLRVPRRYPDRRMWRRCWRAVLREPRYSQMSHISTFLPLVQAARDVAGGSSTGTTVISTTAKTQNRHDPPLAMSSEADEEGIDLFQEPADFYEPEKQASFASHQLLSGQELTVRLVGHNPLWVGDFEFHYQQLH